jgi:hypothetical protein
MPRKTRSVIQSEAKNLPLGTKQPKYVFIAILVLVLMGVGVWLGNRSVSNAVAESPYSAVYLSNGDMYFGELRWFPTPHILNALHLERTTDANNQQHLALVPLSKLFWGPTDEIYLNSKDIIFWTKVRSDSDVVRVFQSLAGGGSGTDVSATPPAPSTTDSSSSPKK